MSKTLPHSNLPENLKTSSEATTISLLNGRFCNFRNPEEKITIHENLTFYRGYIVNHKANGNYVERTETQIKNEKNLRNTKYNGYMSRHTSGYIRRQLTAWLSSIEVYNENYKKKYEKTEAYITFITLTLPSDQVHDDNHIKRNILAPYIQKLKNNHNIKYYFWRSEAQKNGNIHFHLIIDKYMHLKDVQRIWNETLDNYGYIDEFEKKHKHRNPPSTHIRRMDNLQNSINYVIKYVTKEGEYRAINGRIWGMSDELRNIDIFKTNDEIDTEVILKELTLKKELPVIRYEHFNIIITDQNNNLSSETPIFTKNYKAHYLENYKYLYIAGYEYLKVDKIKKDDPVQKTKPNYEQLEIFKNELSLQNRYNIKNY